APSMKVYAVASPCSAARARSNAGIDKSVWGMLGNLFASSPMFHNRVGHPSRMSDGQRTRQGWPAIVANQGFRPIVSRPMRKRDQAPIYQLRHPPSDPKAPPEPLYRFRAHK